MIINNFNFFMLYFHEKYKKNIIVTKKNIMVIIKNNIKKICYDN